MSTAAAITADLPPAVAAAHDDGETKNAVVVVTPIAIEATDAPAPVPAPAAPEVVTATSPALELAESAADVVVPVKPGAASAPRTDTIEPAAVESTTAAVAPPKPVLGDKPHGDAVVFQDDVQVAKDMKEEKKVKKSFISRLSGLFSLHLAPSTETKTSARSTSSASSDEANASTAATNANKPLPTITPTPTPGTPTVTPATPSKTASSDDAAATAATAGAAPENEVEAIANGVEKIEPRPDLPDLKGKQAEHSVVPTKTSGGADEAPVVKETHPAPAATNAVREANANTTPASTEDKKAKSPAAASAKIHRRISARIGQFIDYKLAHEKRKKTSSSSPTAAAAAAAAAVSGVATNEQPGPGKDKDSFVSGSAEPGVPPLPSAAAAHESVPVPATPPVLGEPVTVEPMGELVAEVKVEEPVESGSGAVVKPAAGAIA